MTTVDRTIRHFVAMRMQSLCARLEVWGDPCCVEQLVLQLVEVQLLADRRAAPSNNTNRLMAAYMEFVADVVPDATLEPLAIQLARAGRSQELGPLLQRFAHRVLDQSGPPMVRHSPLNFPVLQAS